MSEEKTYTLQTAGFEYRPVPQPEPDQALVAELCRLPQQFKRAYQSLCPNEWVAKWDDQVENGTFPASLEP
ncbi:hypothetical protein CspeluHIS016_0205740 [Cutaneotrichosporon spelunceum]|uniref:Cytochrome c oxidase subunit VIb n=1 Tax=Cutaneotrichosporon spelunceum TaxID=1672016 RepID=A0AAD3TRW3_9TREE|nr:hypothetical protein CspeluHIS016_0205740 [Cutaneotrichosporon spelunceum]